MLVTCSPDKQFQQNWREADAFFREPVIHTPAVCWLDFCRDDSRRLEPVQALRQDVGCDPLAGILKVLEAFKPSDHQIPHDQQRPAIPKSLQRKADRATRPSPGPPLFSHGEHSINLTCTMQVKYEKRLAAAALSQAGFASPSLD